MISLTAVGWWYIFPIIRLVNIVHPSFKYSLILHVTAQLRSDQGQQKCCLRCVVGALQHWVLRKYWYTFLWRESHVCKICLQYSLWCHCLWRSCPGVGQRWSKHASLLGEHIHSSVWSWREASLPIEIQFSLYMCSWLNTQINRQMTKDMYV